MNSIQEEHRIPVNKYHTIRDSFTGLWRSIASKQQFLKLRLSTSNPTKKEIKEAIQHRNGSISPYSASIFLDYTIIYKKGNTIIITNRPTESLGEFFAVEDSDWENRYFIAFAFSVGCFLESITGMMVYFKEDGLPYSDHITIFDRVIATYDTRNGQIRNEKIALYHQSLFFLQSDPTAQELILSITHLSYTYDTIDTTISYATKYRLGYSFSKNITICKRFVMCGLDRSCVVFDLGSLSIVKNHSTTILSDEEDDEKNDSSLLFYSYVLPSENDILRFLEMAVNFPQREYSDGYPIRCAMCNAPTSAATYYFNDSRVSYTTAGLGNSYCEKCTIRYSHKNKEWVCAKIHIKGYICGGFLQHGWLCADEVEHSPDQNCISIHKGKQHKYPYRNSIQIQWIPSDDAREMMELARWGQVKQPSESHFIEKKDDNDKVNPL